MIYKREGERGGSILRIYRQTQNHQKAAMGMTNNHTQNRVLGVNILADLKWE